MQALPNADFSIDAKFDSRSVATVPRAGNRRRAGLDALRARRHRAELVPDGVRRDDRVRYDGHHGRELRDLQQAVDRSPRRTFRERLVVRLLVRRSALDRGRGVRRRRSRWRAPGCSAGTSEAHRRPRSSAKVDYFVNSNAPPATEDGVAWPTAPSTPVINVWYGSQQTFGANGQPQQWVNVLGDVSDPAGMASLTYSVERRARRARCRWGRTRFGSSNPASSTSSSTTRRSSAGANTVHLTAIDNSGELVDHGCHRRRR